MRAIILLILMITISFSQESTCYGTTRRGALKGGVSLPSSGPNFESYTFIGGLLGRTYMHSIAVTIVVEAYNELAHTAQGTVFKYAETGYKEGGEFSPHKTHRNGLSIDFMTPVKSEGKSVHLPTNIFNKFGYDIEFDKQERYKSYTIDYDAMALHIVTLHKIAVKKGYNLRRVIFDPQLQKSLMKTQYGPYLKKHVTFSKRRSWVRHDEHYHVDFLIPCEEY